MTSRDQVIAQVLDSMSSLRSLRSHTLCSEPFHREVSLSQLQLLAVLHEQHSMTVSEIARALGISLPSASALADRLEDRDYVTRTRTGADRRVVTIEVTPKGRQVVDEFTGVKREQMTRVMSVMTDNELDRFLSGMVALREAIERAAAQDELIPPLSAAV